MHRIAGLACVTLLLCGCSRQESAGQCAPLSSVVPKSINPELAAGFTARFAGPDRANSIAEAITQIHAADPSLNADQITNILIVADCPNAAASGAQDEAGTRTRLGRFRAQVVTLLGDQSIQ